MGPPTYPGPVRGWPPPCSPFLGSVPGEGGERGSPRAQGRSRFPQARCPAQEPKSRSLDGGGEQRSPVQPGPPDSHFSHHQSLLLYGTLWPPVLYAPTQIAPEPAGPPLSPSPILSLLPPSSPRRPLKDPAAQTPRPWSPRAPCSRPRSPQGKPPLGPGEVEALTTGRDRPGQGEGVVGDTDKEKIGHSPKGPATGVPEKMG